MSNGLTSGPEGSGVSLGITGWQIVAARDVSGNLVVDVASEARSGRLTISGDCTWSAGRVPGQLAELEGHRIADAKATPDGSLQLAISAFAEVTVRPLPTREAWQYFRSDYHWGVVCTPGGEIEIFGSGQ
jgi:Family of unknown function (DUF6188)